MLGKFSYLIYDLIIISIAIPIYCIPSYRKFLIAQKDLIAIIVLLYTVPGIISNFIAKKWECGYISGEKVLGYYILNMPLEDILFVIIIVFLAASATLAIAKFFKEA